MAARVYRAPSLAGNATADIIDETTGIVRLRIQCADDWWDEEAIMRFLWGMIEGRERVEGLAPAPSGNGDVIPIHRVIRSAAARPALRDAG